MRSHFLDFHDSMLLKYMYGYIVGVDSETENVVIVKGAREEMHVVTARDRAFMGWC